MFIGENYNNIQNIEFHLNYDIFKEFLVPLSFNLKFIFEDSLKSDLLLNFFPRPSQGRDKTMGDKLMYVPEDDQQNNPFCRLNNWMKIFDIASLGKLMKTL